MLTIPDSVRKPLREGYGWQPRPKDEWTQFGVSNRVTEIYSGNSIDGSLHVLLSTSMAQLLDAFLILVRNDNPQGWFIGPANIGRGLDQYQMRVLNPEVLRGLVGADYWDVPFNIEIRSYADGTYWDYTMDEAEIIVSLGDEDIVALANKLYTAVNEVRPE